MIKSFKIFERFWFRNIIIGEIYHIYPVNRDWVNSIPFCKIIEKDDNLRTIDFETYSSKTNEKMIFSYYYFNLIKRKATDEEKIYFETFEEVNKYNI